MEHLLHIEDILEGMTAWSCVVTVQEKLQPTTAINSPSRYQRFVLADSKGGRVQGIVFNHEIERMGKKMQVFKKYKIKNAEVKKLKKEYQYEGISMQWIINSRTILEPIESVDALLDISYHFTDFERLTRYIDAKKESVDVLALVIDSLPAKTIKSDINDSVVQKLVLLNQSMKTVMLSIWNEFVKNEGASIIDNLDSFPVIICRRVKVVYYNGTALTTKYDSAILVNPPVESALRLKNWAERNKEMLSDFVISKNYFKSTPEISLDSYNKTSLVASITPFQKNVLVKAQLSFKNICQKYWYMACPKCFQSTSARQHEEYTCNLCDSRQIPEPRSRFEVDVIDDSGIITASIFGHLAEKLLTFSANEAVEYANKNIDLPLQEIHQNLQSKLFLVQIRPMKLKSADSRQRYTITSYTEFHEGQSSASTLEHVGTDAANLLPTNTSESCTMSQSEGPEDNTSSPKARVRLLDKLVATDAEDKLDAKDLTNTTKKKQKLD